MAAGSGTVAQTKTGFTKTVEHRHYWRVRVESDVPTLKEFKE